MTDTIKAQLIHKQIMMIIKSEIAQKAFKMNEGWNKESHNRIQHTVDVIEANQIKDLIELFTAMTD